MKRVDFKKVTIVNFLSVGEEPVSVEFTKGLHVITGKNKDDLQTAINLIKKEEDSLDIAIQFENYR